jgi:putative ABC transport system substrate-binding protein
MNETIQIRFFDSYSDNLKSKIENLKWLGLLERKRIVELAGKYRLPAISSQKEFVDEGGLMSYGADYDDLYRRAAVYVDKILKGAKPADLPVQQATKFEFVIN